MTSYETFLKTLTALFNLIISIVNIYSARKKIKNSSNKEEPSTQKKV